MKLKCMECETIRFREFSDRCPKCHTISAYLQEPSLVEVQGNTYHLEEILKHKTSNNQFQIKEIQKNGLVVKVKFNPVLPNFTGKNAYISKNDLHEYEVMK